MSNYDNTNSGALFKSDAEWLAENPNRPHYTGSLNVNGVDMRLAGWKKMSKNGKPFLSLKLSEKEGGATVATVTASADDLPF